MNGTNIKLADIEGASIHAWIVNNAIKTETGKLIDFRNHRYLYDIYRDTSKYLCCLKAGQIGFSTMAILKTLWLSRNQKIDIGYILPTVEMVQKFVGSKVNRMAQQNPIIQQWMRDKDSIVQKQIGENYIFYLGAQTERSAIMLSLDMLVADEFDKAPQDILEVYDSRLQHSDYGYKWVFSNPTIPNFGVDRFWLQSDQKRWFVKHACGKVFVLDEACIDYDREIYACPSCKEEITDEQRRLGDWYDKDGKRWKGELTDYQWSGWSIPLWLNPNIPASTIAEHKRTKTKEYFYNFVAGVPYVNPNDALSQQTLERNLNAETNIRENRTIIGLDTGHNLHYTMMNKQGVFYHGYCPSIAENPIPGYDPYTEIEQRMTDDESAVLLADQGGDLIGVRKLQVKFPGRVFLVWSVKETRNQQLIRWGEDAERGKVLIDRNRVIQLAVDELNEGRIPFNGTLEDWQPFFDHALNIYRVKEITDENEPQYGWKWVWMRKGPDHWFMSMIYARVGMDKFAQDKAVFIRKDNWRRGIPKASRIDNSIPARRFVPTKLEGYNDVNF